MMWVTCWCYKGLTLALTALCMDLIACCYGPGHQYVQGHTLCAVMSHDV